MSSPASQNRFLEKLKKRELSLGSWLSLYHPALPEIYCKAGLDWVTIDLEHSVISLAQAEELIRIVDLHDCTPLVRLSGVVEKEMKTVLESGAQGIIAPNIETKEQIDQLYSWMRYPKDGGKRGVGLARAQEYGPAFHSYMDEVSNDIPLVIQIESAKAVENIDELLGHPNVSAFMVGPYDLSSSLGIPGQFDHPVLKETLDKIMKAAVKHNIPSGAHLVEPHTDELQKLIAAGHSFVAYSVDFRMIDTTLRAATSLVK